MPAQDFDYFVVLAGMRTGSNLLEEHLAAFPGVDSYGEVFNPHFFGKPETQSLFGLSMAARESDPVRVIGAMRSNARGLPGFRLFYDHDPRAIDHVLKDPKAAKIVLTRRPIDSYVSLKIARKTGQWWLGDLKTARAAKVPFDPEGYAEFLTTLSAFQSNIALTLQRTGQTAFHISYDDLGDSDVIAGLGRFLGLEHPQDADKIRAKVQNPTSLADRLTNPQLAEDTLRSIAMPDIGQVPHHEPDRGPGLKFFRACETAPLLYMPIRGAGLDPIPDWLEACDPGQEVISGMTQRDLRRWKRQHPGHRSFTVVRHPLARAHDAFCRFILPTDEANYADIRTELAQRYDVPLPGEWPSQSWSLEDHRAAFLAFLTFLKGSLGGQTSLRVDNTWATQGTLLGAIAAFAIPDRVVRESALNETISALASEAGLTNIPQCEGFTAPGPYALADVHNDDIEKAAEAAYRRDYMMFGFSRWRDPQAA